MDVLVLGSGVAGLSVAMTLYSIAGAAEPLAGMRIGILTKAELADATTRWAQGGVAVVLPVDGSTDRQGRDSTALHLDDTVAAGAGLCDTDAVGVLVREGPRRVQDLIALGTVFDRQPSGELALAREGGHSTARVVHAGGAATGAEVERALVEAVRATPAVILE
ncbi:MAG: L-aspartate oxidase, partial [Acidimicrobiales bacterium]